MNTSPQPFTQSLSFFNGLMLPLHENNKNQLAFPNLNLNNPAGKFPVQDLLDHENQLSSSIPDSFFDISGSTPENQILSPSHFSPLEEDFCKPKHQHDYDDMIKDFLLSSVSESSKTILKKSHSSSPSLISKQASLQTTKRQRRTWKPEEDALVMQLIEQHGHRWNKISQLMNNRSGKQIRDRYLNVLMPNINKSSWTKQEDEMLVSLYQQHGSKWRHIAKELKGRTEAQVKNRFHTYLKGIFVKRLSTKNIKVNQNPICSPSTCLESPHSYNSLETNGKMTDLIGAMFSFNS